MAASVAEVLGVSPPTPYTRCSTGCWTCRVRRKKCDERRGECSTCLALQIECAGYGAKPTWMDGAQREKEMAREIKEHVKKQRKRGRRPRAVSGPAAVPQSVISAESSRSTSDMCDRLEADNGSSGLAIVRGDDSSRPTSDMCDALEDDNGSSALATVRGDDCSTEQSISLIHDVRSTIPFPSEALLEPDAPLQLDMLTWTQSDAIWNQLFSDPGLPTPGLTVNPISFGLNNSMSSMAEPWAMAEQSNEEEQVHYCMNHVLPSLFPFLGLQVLDMLRDRLVNGIASNKKMLRSATLAHGAYVQKLGLERLGIALADKMKQAISRGRNEALSQIRDVVSCESNVTTCHSFADNVVDGALSLLQLALLQIREGVSDHDGIASLMEALYDRCRASAIDGDRLSGFACTVFLSIGVLSMASFRGQQYLSADFASTRAEDFAMLDFAGALGCESWVFQCVAKTTQLRSWKQEKVASQALSVIELARRATKLEQSLEQNLQSMQQRPSSASSSTVLITQIYAAAAKIYIHVVVSGANPEVMEIVDAVDTAVKALQRLSHGSLIRRLAWPLCVVASLARLRQEAFFTSLEAGVQRDQDECTSVLRALEVARETRQMRRASSNTEVMVDWMDALENLGQEWIMI